MDLSLILFENQIQTTSASPCRTQVQPTASFLVCSLIFIEYKSAPGHILHSNSLIKRTETIVKAIKKEYNECKTFRRWKML